MILENYQSIFESVPGLYLILLPDFTIVSVSDAYLEATMTTREGIMGHGLFEIFPDNPDDPAADGVSNLRSSLQTVLQTREVHRMDVQKYDIRRPDGTFEERYWSPVNKPIVKENAVQLIIHSVVDVTAQKQAENKIKTTELLLHSSIESLKDMIILSVDRNYKYLNYNTAHTAATKIAYGVDLEVGMSILDHITVENDRLKVKDNFDRAFLGESHVTIDEYGEFNRFYFETRYNPIINENEEIIGATAFAVNITDRKKSEIELLEANRFLDTIIENIPNMLFIKDAGDLRFVRLNTAGEELLGYPRNTLMGKNDYDFFPKEQADFFIEKDREVLRNGILLDIPEEKISTSHGDKWLHTKKIPIIGPDGRATYLLGISEDITSRKESDEQVILINEKLKSAIKDVEASNELFSKLFNLNPVSIAISRLSDSTIFDVNEAFINMFGFASKDDVIGMTGEQLNIFVNPLQREDILNILKKEQKVVNFEGQIKDKSGNIKWGSTSVHIIEISGVACMLAVIIDITQRKENEELLKAQAEKLNHINQELEAFSYSVSHDLKAPLRSLQGFSKALLETYSGRFDEDADRWLHFIEDNANRMGDLIDDILNFSKVSRTNTKMAEINMHSLVNEIFESEGRNYRNKKIKLELEILPNCWGDQTMMRQVWQNLISNAIKYSSKNDFIHVKIGSRIENNMMVYSIQDNGVGFDEKYKEKLFGVFQRLHSSAEFEGTGVGLAIANRIIQKHNGWIDASSEKGKGSVFCFAIPI